MDNGPYDNRVVGPVGVRNRERGDLHRFLMNAYFEVKAKFYVVGLKSDPDDNGHDTREYDCYFIWPDGSDSNLLRTDMPAIDLFDTLICESIQYASDLIE